MRWTKLGLVYEPAPNPPAMVSHAVSPLPIQISHDVYRVFFASRDDKVRSHIWFFEISLREPFEVLRVSERPVLSPGPIGTYDEHGVFPSSMVQHDGKYYLYTSCWVRGERPPMNYNSIGLAVSEDGVSFRRRNAPIMARSEFDPCFVAMPMVRHEMGRWRMWYSSGYRWEEKNGALESYYNIRIAESGDGIHWLPTDQIAIDHADSEETSIARPWIVRRTEGFQAWYGYARGPGRYRIGCATSGDGFDWQRRDSEAGIELSKSGWDSQMMAHPAVVEYDGRQFMFYNGDRFGRDGIGLAVAESDNRSFKPCRP